MKTFILILTIMSSYTDNGNSVTIAEFHTEETCRVAAKQWTDATWKAKKDQRVYGYPLAICVAK